MRLPVQYKLLLLYIVVGLGIGGLVVLYAYVVRGIIDAQYAFSDLALHIADEEQGQGQAILAASLLKNRSDDIERIRSVLVDAKNPLPFIESLERIGRDTHNAIALNVNENQDTRGILVVGVTVEGSRISVVQYLQAVALLPYALSVSEINLQQLRQGESALVKDAKVAPTHRLTLILRVKSI